MINSWSKTQHSWIDLYDTDDVRLMGIDSSIHSFTKQFDVLLQQYEKQNSTSMAAGDTLDGRGEVIKYGDSIDFTFLIEKQNLDHWSALLLCSLE